MVNIFQVGQLVTSVLFGTISIVSIVKEAISMAFLFIFAMCISEILISYLERTYSSTRKAPAK